MNSITRCLIVGASGLLGAAFAKNLFRDKVQVDGVVFNNLAPDVVASQQRLDLSKPVDEGNLDLRGYDLIIYCSAITSIEVCEKNEDLAEMVHVFNAEKFALAAARAGSKFVYISTDQLWDGRSSRMTEQQLPCPLNAYGRTKSAGELAVLEAYQSALVVRTNFLARGEAWQKSFADWVISSLERGETITGYGNVIHTPLHVDYLYTGLVALLQANTEGIFHVAGGEVVSKLAVVRTIAKHLRIENGCIQEGQLIADNQHVLRPLDMSLDTSKIERLVGWKAPSLAESVELL